ncbi:MAG: hypothetical protein EHM24_18265 [Acidobacteria bacterium]|nr:MAG: hypothetical protein EHM24_18265 [Acidobacteriota bacterium]
MSTSPRPPALRERWAYRLPRLTSAWQAAGWYLAATLLLTWPLARGLGSDIPADTGDSLLNCWILAWGADHVIRFVGGDLHAFDGFWNGNFFHPASLTLAYSEHLFPQVLQIAPVYALTGNVILCYNLVFLSTFVLCGLGTYLLVRELTGHPAAGFLAGLFFAFAPYRLAQFPHVQVLSIQWMAFALYGLTRYAKTGGLWPLAGASVALLAQNLSCGYFLLYFGPFAAAYGTWEVVRRRLPGWPLALGRLALAFAAVGALTLPFLLPYMDLRALGFPPRSLGELSIFSADVLSYLTGPTTSHGTARLFQAYQKPEGEVFLGLVPMALALAGLVLAWRDARHQAREAGYGIGRLEVPARWGRPVSVLLTVVLVAELAALAFILIGGPRVLRLGSVAVRLRDMDHPAVAATLAGLALLAWSRRARVTARQLAGSVGFWAVAAAVAALLSLGPSITSGGIAVGPGPYRLLYEHVPGFDGIRVPARLALEVALFVAVLAGFALARLRKSSPDPNSAGLAGRHRSVFAVLGLLFLVEVWPPPILINHTDPVERAVTPPSPVPYGRQTPPVYAFLAGLPEDTVILEMPFGREGYELRYLFYSTLHWRRLVNGYSGGLTDRYYLLTLELGHPVRNWDRAWEALATSTAQVVVVHEGAYLGDQGPRVSGWLEHHGARRLAAFGPDVVFALSPEAGAGR